MAADNCRKLKPGAIVTFIDSAGRSHRGVVLFSPTKEGYLEIELPGNKAMTIHESKITKIEYVRDNLKQQQLPPKEDQKGV